MLLLFWSTVLSPKKTLVFVTSKVAGVIIKLLVKAGIYSVSLEVIFSLMFSAVLEIESPWKLAKPSERATVVVPVNFKSGSLFSFKESVTVPLFVSITFPRPSINLIEVLKSCPACMSNKLFSKDKPCSPVIIISVLPINTPSTKALILARPGAIPGLYLTVVAPLPISWGCSNDPRSVWNVIVYPEELKSWFPEASFNVAVMYAKASSLGFIVLLEEVMVLSVADAVPGIKDKSTVCAPFVPPWTEVPSMVAPINTLPKVVEETFAVNVPSILSVISEIIAVPFTTLKAIVDWVETVKLLFWPSFNCNVINEKSSPSAPTLNLVVESALE